MGRTALKEVRQMCETSSYPDIERVISPEVVSQILGKSRSWVYGHAAELGASRIGSSWIFTKEGLTEALKKARREDSPKKHAKHSQEKLVITKRSTKVLETVKDGLKRHGIFK